MLQMKPKTMGAACQLDQNIHVPFRLSIHELYPSSPPRSHLQLLSRVALADIIAAYGQLMGLLREHCRTQSILLTFSAKCVNTYACYTDRFRSTWHTVVARSRFRSSYIHIYTFIYQQSCIVLTGLQTDQCVRMACCMEFYTW